MWVPGSKYTVQTVFTLYRPSRAFEFSTPLGVRCLGEALETTKSERETSADVCD